MDQRRLTVEYQLPSESLRKWISHYWLVRGEFTESQVQQTIYPRPNCGLTIQFADPINLLTNAGSIEKRPRIFAKGHFAAPFRLIYKGTFASAGVSFFPGQAHHFLKVSESEINNQFVGLTEIYGSKGTDLEKQLLARRELSAIARVFDNFLSKQLETRLIEEELLAHTISIIIKKSGNVSVTDLAARAGVTRRRIHREFSRTIGLSPKYFCKLVRFYHLLKMMNKNKSVQLTQLSHELGYHDQSHMIHSFKEFTGQTPTEYSTREHEINNVSLNNPQALLS